MTPRHTIYTPANGLSVARLLSALPCAYAVAVSNWPVAVAAFCFAVATDIADGPLARRRGEASPVGGLVDHATDALFCIAVLGAFAASGPYPVLLPFVIGVAFAQYVADSRVLAGKKLRASRIGRCNGIAYFVLAGTPIVRNAPRLVLAGRSAALRPGMAAHRDNGYFDDRPTASTGGRQVASATAAAMVKSTYWPARPQTALCWPWAETGHRSAH